MRIRRPLYGLKMASLGLSRLDLTSGEKFLKGHMVEMDDQLVDGRADQIEVSLRHC